MQRTIVRNLLASDVIPFSALTRGGPPFGFEQLPLDPDLTWVAIRNGAVVGVLACGSISLLLILCRIAVTEDASPITPMLLCKRAFTAARRRGFLGYVTFLSDSAAAESHLMRIVQRSGGNLIPQSGAWAFGDFERFKE